ncbi:hypothetical protein CDAR_38011 [Caerostris darwini]|uniref:Chitin-binding type-2 domain-containing protein n=1 Tax=Caerostris darwini TaxID=1538125 RepID=A0AAV4PN42_9ARAC|nr:hypothetical protein CDAR_38011 [Caerostris darwini]
MHSLFFTSALLYLVSAANGLTCKIDENFCYEADVSTGCRNYLVHLKSVKFYFTCSNGRVFDETTAKCTDPSEFQCDITESTIQSSIDLNLPSTQFSSDSFDIIDPFLKPVAKTAFKMTTSAMARDNPFLRDYTLPIVYEMEPDSQEQLDEDKFQFYLQTRENVGKIFEKHLPMILRKTGDPCPHPGSRGVHGGIFRRHGARAEEGPGGILRQPRRVHPRQRRVPRECRECRPHEEGPGAREDAPRENIPDYLSHSPNSWLNFLFSQTSVLYNLL